MDLLECRLDINDLDSFVADLTAIGERHGATLQTVDARYVADRRHLERAVELADRAIERGENVARDRAVEILLYAAGRRQIDRALEMGVGEGENRAVVLIDATPHSDSKNGSDLDAARAAVTELEAFAGTEPTLDQQDEDVLRTFFDITDAERAATDASLAALVRERVALLDVEK
ncbi:KEOPS complex subunit Cgi121 [Natrialba asiatica]|uniref:KEOPS complex Cgi121-like subunit n=1 Tax=Natrialba asiatica (strain ATCC 700177 / DSM 12278 / JCM 9576 / FERM P-10747 / NBRC 102637 / 172P1) TaxID=29540 RepID=M0AJF9_NATA1|nr:KEOPS complex subunit Cgi121 [Natrialba asiatica]ELY98012.1 KEOPS complex Cgi121-like subunit [Natrialba asiatica DSM 12278]